jgi:hypothetical protein
MPQEADRKTEAALNSLQGIQQASPGPYFFTRLEARMLRTKTRWEHIISLLTQPAIAVAGLLIVLLLNAVVVFTSATNKNNNTASASTGLAIADEYSQLSTAFYDYENMKP